MQVNDIWDIFGGILLLALVATVLVKPNTAAVVKAGGTQFDNAISAAEAG